MGDEAPAEDDFDWDLRSSSVRVGNKLPIPENLRDWVVIDSGGDPATWWGYDKETGYAFLSSDYTNGDRFLTVNNRSYKLEKGSRVTIPKPEKEEITEGVLGSDRPNKRDAVYFYSDSRMKTGDLFSVIVLSKKQLAEVIDDDELMLDIFGFDNENQFNIGGAPGISRSEIAKQIQASDEQKIKSQLGDEVFRKKLPVPE